MLNLRGEKPDLLYDHKVSKKYKIEFNHLKEGEKISLLSDSMFKTMFLNQNRLKYSCKLLSYYLDISYQTLLNNIRLSTNELDKRYENERERRVDYIANIQETSINIEVNNNSDIYTMERNMEYAHRLYARKLRKGQNNSKYSQVIQFNLNNFSFDGNDKILDRYVLQNEEGTWLSNQLIFIQIYIPNLRKKWYTKGINSLSEEEKYLLGLVEPNVEESKKLGEGNEVMEEFIEDAVIAIKEEELLESYDKELALKEEYRKEGVEEGIKLGIEQGIKQGIEQGVKQNTESIVKNLLKENISVEIIMKITGLSKEKIEEMKESK